ncbi:MAG: hypothetical protein ACKVTZ_13065 [Bacteroidia bacterium]
MRTISLSGYIRNLRFYDDHLLFDLNGFELHRRLIQNAPILLREGAYISVEAHQSWFSEEWWAEFIYSQDVPQNIIPFPYSHGGVIPPLPPEVIGTPPPPKPPRFFSNLRLIFILTCAMILVWVILADHK